METGDLRELVRASDGSGNRKASRIRTLSPSGKTSSRRPPPGDLDERDPSLRSKVVTRAAHASHRRHRVQELAVRARLVEFLDEELHRLDGRQRREDFAQHPDAIELVALEEQFFFARAGAIDVD